MSRKPTAKRAVPALLRSHPNNTILHGMLVHPEKSNTLRWGVKEE